jgi:acyl-CoA reductase-like NAD-dependent aldehyde dehydrogenase
LRGELSSWHSQNSGQNCIGIERLVVHQDQYDDLYAILRDGASKLRLGPVLAPSPEGYVSPVDCGAMIDRERFQSLERLIEDARAEGAEVFGGYPWDHVYHAHGTYFAATIVGPANNEMEIAQTERE